MASYISTDIAHIDSIIAGSQATSVNVSAAAVKITNLKNELILNPQFFYSKTWVDTFTRGVVYYNQYNDTGYWTLSNGLLYGNQSDFFGIVSNFAIISAPSLASYNAGTYKIIDTYSTWNYAGGTVSMSAGPGAVWSNGSTISSASTDSLRFHVNRFSFINQYLWADPTNQAHLNATANSTTFNIKFGVSYNAQSLLNSSTALLVDTTFYANKKTYLSSLL